MPGTSSAKTRFALLPGHDFQEAPMTQRDAHPALRARAGDRCAFFGARRCGAAHAACACVRRFAAALPFRLCFSASIRLMTLSGFSARSAVLMGLPAAL